MESSQMNFPKKNIAGKVFFYFISIIVAFILVIVLTCVFMTSSQSNVPVIMSYSMFSINTQGGFVPSGDMAICKIKNGSEITVGEKVVFKDGYDSFKNAIITTGVVKEVETTNGESLFKLQIDDTARPVGDIIGEVSFAIPKLGMITDFIKTPLGLIYCVAVPLFLLLIFEIVNLIRLSKRQKQEDNEQEANLPSYMRIGEDEESENPTRNNIDVDLNEDMDTGKPAKKPFKVDDATVTQGLISGLNNKITYEQQDEILELVEPKGAFQSVNYKKPVAVKEAAHADSIYSTREWQLPVEPLEKPQEVKSFGEIPQEPKPEPSDFSATVGADTKNHFQIEGIDVRVVSDAIKLSMDNDTQNRDISITVTDEYTNVVVETKTAEINFALFKDETDHEQKVIIQKKVKE